MDTETKNNETSAFKIGVGYAVNAVSSTFNAIRRAHKKGIEKVPFLMSCTVGGLGSGVLYALSYATFGDADHAKLAVIYPLALVSVGASFEAGVRGVNYLGQASKDAKKHKQQAQALKNN